MMRVMIPALRRSLDDTDASFRASAARQLGVAPGEMGEVQILRQAVDARKKGDVFFSVHCRVDLAPKAAKRVLGDKKLHAQPWQAPEPLSVAHGERPLSGRVLVVGMGPAGLFAGWLLAREGYRPLIIDRGKAMEDRVRDVEGYWCTG
ncbi:MAG: FAD-dependent monooxygenase, partial [Clostridia bacterium]|nr:FAD-dependent monooxygenase [Clostridia bacterium]